MVALASEDGGDAAFTARSFRSFEFCNTHRYDRFFRRLAYAHHVDDEARSDLIKACHMLLHERKRSAPVIRHQLEEQLVASALPRALASIGVKKLGHRHRIVSLLHAQLAEAPGTRTRRRARASLASWQVR